MTDERTPIGRCAGCDAVLVYRTDDGGYALSEACGCSEGAST